MYKVLGLDAEPVVWHWKCRNIGAQVNCVSRRRLKQVGLTRENFLNPEVILGCSNETLLKG